LAAALSFDCADGKRKARPAETAAAADEERKRWERLREQDVDLEDLYALLGLSELELEATSDDIRQAYRMASLFCHPDKAPPHKREEAEARFKALVKAYETLIDPAKRRVYDSSLPFDDAVPGPSEGATPADFFRVYAPVFERNARFSVLKPVPRLGDAETPFDEVNRMYDFWLSFQSWREFQHPDEQSVDEAQSREERRHIERENAKLRAGMKREEISRVRRFVESAMAKDPRVAAERERERERKAAKKRQRDEERRRREEEEERRRRAEEEKKLAEQRAAEEAARKAKEEKEQSKQLRRALRAAVKQQGLGGGAVTEDDLAFLFERIAHASLADLAARCLPPGADGSQPIPEQLKQSGGEALRAAIARERAEKARQQAEAEEKLAAKRLRERKEREAEEMAKEWTLEEESLLARAIARYPGGTSQRWELIAEMVSSATPRSVKEVIRKAKEFESRRSVRDQDAFSIYVKKMREKGVDLSSKPLDAAESASAAAAAAAPAAPAAASAPAAAAVAAPTSDPKPAPTPAPAAEAAAKSKAKTQPKPAGAPAGGGGGGGSAWTAEQQAALESALRSVPKGDDRWDRIAELVPGKSKRECVERFKEIREQIQARKAARG
jgi:DnaJ family protein C protein 2